MRNKLLIIAGVCGLLHAQAQPPRPDAASSYRVNLPAGGPLALDSADWGASRTAVRGGAIQVDLHSTLFLKNTSNRRLRGVSLLVVAQEVTPGGKGSVTVPSIDVLPGETFPIRLDLRLMRPLAAGQGPLVEVGLDAVLFDDLTCYGPNRLNGYRALVAWELEARRDRQTLLAAFEAGGAEALRGRLLAALSRLAAQPGIEMRVSRALPATMPSTNVEPGRTVEFAFLRIPESPVDLLSGAAQMSGNEARSPRIDIQSRARRPIRYVELGWLVRDAQGQEFLAGSLPADVSLNPGQKSSVTKENVLRFSRPVAGLTAFPAMVEYADGSVWVPPASALRDPRLAAALPPSGEEQRLAELYRRKGLDAVVLQLKSLR